MLLFYLQLIISNDYALKWHLIPQISYTRFKKKTLNINNSFRLYNNLNIINFQLTLRANCFIHDFTHVILTSFSSHNIKIIYTFSSFTPYLSFFFFLQMVGFQMKDINNIFSSIP